jgi:adenylate cyclase
MATECNDSATGQRTVAELEAELRQRTAERDEALAQQAATAEILQVINSSPGELAPVFDAILEKARALCGVAIGALEVWDGKHLRALATHGLPESFDEVIRRGWEPGPDDPQWQLVNGARFVHFADQTALNELLARKAVELAGVHTVLIVPLRKDSTLLGRIVASRREVRPFTDKEIALLANFAEQAVTAMENARLLAETREALERQTATAEVLQVINASPGNLAPVFEAILEKAHSLCGATKGALFTFDGEQFRVAATRGLSEVLIAILRDRAREIKAGYPVDELSPREQLLNGATLVELTGSALAIGPLGRAAAELGIRRVLFVPLRRDGPLLGYITAYREEDTLFSEKQIALLQNFATQAVIAMENARLLTEQREALERQTATAEVLGIINANTGNLTPVFHTILEKAHTLCGAAIGSLVLYDGRYLRAAATHGHPEQYAEVVRRPQLPTRRIQPLMNGERFVHVLDMKADEEEMDHEVARSRSAHDMRTALWMPLRKDSNLLGFISAYRTEVRPFSEKEIALLENFAAQAVIAMENARLLGELRQRTEEVAELNRGLEARVAAQVEELGRVGRLKRFLAPQLAELIVSQGNERILESHRREIVVVFCDLRGYTAFTETAEPEEVLDFLREYHGALGPLVSQYEGTLDQFSGDGIMVFFNDPVPVPDPAERAIKMAVAMREAAGLLITTWRRRGRDLGFGAGIAQGYATLGQIGFSERSGYTAIGTVCNVAARLCAEAKDGQILLSQRVAAGLDGSIAIEELGPLTLKGLTQPVVAYNVPPAGGQAAFRVIEGRPQGA